MEQTAHTSAPVVGIGWGTVESRGVLTATILASSLVFVDGTSSNVALPAIGQDLGLGISGLQWTINAYMLALTALILLGGSLGDRYGHRRVFVAGVIWFSTASVLCGLAPNGISLIAARALQGIGGALLTPVSLAIIQTSFRAEDRGRAVGAWSGISGVGAAIGPVLGGWFVDIWSWRLIFLSNLVIAIPALLTAIRFVPESRLQASSKELDFSGAVLAALGLTATSWALISAGEQGWTGEVLLTTGAGLLAIMAFLVVEIRSKSPMMPLSIFNSRQFSVANAVTVAVYGAFSVMLFLLMIQLQQVLGYSPLEAGLASIPITGLLLVLSARAGRFAQEIGPRIPMAAGPIMMGIGMLLMLRIEGGATYLADVLPAVIVFGLGLTLTVAPLTATVLASVDPTDVGVGSGVNNAISRGAGLLAVAVLPGLAGISGESYVNPEMFDAGFDRAMRIAAVISISGGIIAWLFIKNRLEGDRNACAYDELDRQYHCAVDGAPIHPAEPRRTPSRPSA